VVADLDASVVCNGVPSKPRSAPAVVRAHRSGGVGTHCRGIGAAAIGAVFKARHRGHGNIARWLAT
jgi:hypothetical protein